MKSEIFVREIKSTDYECIHELNYELGYEYPKEKVQERIEYILKNTKDTIFVAELGKKIIGYIHISPYELLYSDSLINVLGFVVKEEYRSTGVGNRLIMEIEHWAKENNFSGIRLVSGYDREKAHSFYEKHGYSNRKLQKNFIKMVR